MISGAQFFVSNPGVILPLFGNTLTPAGVADLNNRVWPNATFGPPVTAGGYNIFFNPDGSPWTRRSETSAAARCASGVRGGSAA